MAYSSLIHLKTLLMVLTAAGGTVTGGVLANSYVNSANRDPGSFLITLNPSTMWTVQGASSTSTITVTSINGYTGNVSLTVTAPFGFITVTGGENPLTIASGGAASSTLAITTSTNTAKGNYSMIITGSDGSRSHSTTISLQVVDPIPAIIESLVLNSYHFNNSTSLTLYLQNAGNGTITLQSYVIRDSSGNAWSLSSWIGPSIEVNAVGRE